MLGGGSFGGGFLNLGAPEVIVIGAVAWVVLGPKELFRLSKEAGQFIGQWQQLGQQAKDTFTNALNEELMEDEKAKAAADFSTTSPPPAWGESPAVPPPIGLDDMKTTVTTGSAEAARTSAGGSMSDIPTLEEFQAQRAAAEAAGSDQILTEEQEAKIRAELYGTLGDPEENASNFAEQMSGARNAAVLSEYPQELTSEDEPWTSQPADGSPLDVQSADEQLLQIQIDETENELATLRAEKQVLALKRKQIETNAERARRMAEERIEMAEEKLAAAEAAEPGKQDSS